METTTLSLEQEISILKEKHEREIENLNAKFELEVFAKRISCGVKHNACLFSKRNFISFEPKTIEEAQTLLNNIKPTNVKQVIGTVTDKYYKTFDSPYQLSIDNPASPSNYNPFTLKIKFEYNDVDIWIKIPINLITDYKFVAGARNITDSEYHYFTGTSMSNLRKMVVKYFNFNHTSVINFYGGGKNLYCPIETDKIISAIINQKPQTESV